MDAPPSPPSQLANRIIRQFVDHLFGEDMLTFKDDFLAIRVVYRKMGGNWIPLIDGNKEAIGLLENIVTGWGQMPGRKRKSEEGI